MAGEERPQIYLLTPADFEIESFAPRLARVLDGAEIACLRLAMAGRDEGRIAQAADRLRPLAHERDIAIVIDTHLRLAERHGLDGVHLPDGARSVREARRLLGPDAIVGSHCGTSRHDGMNAGEAGADYVAFGPVGGSLGTGALAERELFAWWSEMIEVPVVAEGGLSPRRVAELAPVTDFFAIGDEIWAQEDPLAALRDLTAAIG
ncbi:thiamine phosphate synthase [Albidovulum sp.]